MPKKKIKNEKEEEDIVESIMTKKESTEKNNSDFEGEEENTEEKSEKENLEDEKKKIEERLQEIESVERKRLFMINAPRVFEMLNQNMKNIHQRIEKLEDNFKIISEER